MLPTTSYGSFQNGNLAAGSVQWRYPHHSYASHQGYVFSQGYPVAVVHQNATPHLHLLFSPLPDLPTPDRLFAQTPNQFNQARLNQVQFFQPQGHASSLTQNSSGPLYYPVLAETKAGEDLRQMGIHAHHIKHPTENPELLANRVAEHTRFHDHLPDHMDIPSSGQPSASKMASPKMIPTMPMRQPYETAALNQPVSVELPVPKESKAKRTTSHNHDHEAANGKPSRWTALAKAVGLIGFGLVLHSLPARKSSLGTPLISSDWKDIARIALGIGAVQQINKALDWKPAPWLSAIQAVAVMNPIATGVLTKEGLLSLRNLGQIAVMSVLVAPLVQLSATLDKTVVPKLKEDWGIPSWIPRVGMMAGMMGAGLYAYPKMFNWVSRQTLLGRPVLGQQALKDALHQLEHAKENAAAGMIMCYRNCCAGSIVCLSELGEILSSFMNGVTGKNKTQQGEQKS